MTLPPPPPAPGIPPSGGIGAPVVTTPRPSSSGGSERTSPSRLPLIIAIALLVIGAVLLVFTGGNQLIGIVGYVLDGLALPLLVGWDVVSQRNGMKNRNFISSPRQSLLLRIIMGVGLVVALIHIWSLAFIWAEALSDMWGLH
ncbi:MAG: hypothetical protein RLZZ600_1108 [Actinomycetota bacterium]|jgi:hypothetical protein